MWDIAKKDSKFVLIYLVSIMAMITLLRFLVGDPLGVTFVLLSVILIYMLVFGEIFINEQYEEKHHGYVFLSTLPLKISEIVTAKFLRVLFTSVLLIGYIVLLMSLSPDRQDSLVLARSFILFNGVAALLAAALAFIGLFGTGYTIFLKVSLFFLVLFLMIPFLLLSTGKMDAFIQSVIDFLPTINWLIVFPVVLVVYFGLMGVAIKLKELRPA